MGYGVLRPGELEWEERPFAEGEPARLAAHVTSAAGLTRSRARVWRYPLRTRGRRHADRGGAEFFLDLR